MSVAANLVEHLAVFRRGRGPATRDRAVTVRRHPLGTLTWTFTRAADARGLTDYVANLSDARRGELADAVALTLKSEAGEQTLVLRAGPAADDLRELLPTLVLDRARSLMEKGRNVRAEDYLARIPVGTKAHAAGERLRAEIGTIVRCACRSPSGLPGVAAGCGRPARPPRARVLRRGRRAIGRSRDPCEAVLEVGRGCTRPSTRSGSRPAEEVLAARWAIIDPFLHLGAQAAVASAKQELADARFGQPLSNRLVLLVPSREGGSVLFGVAGEGGRVRERRASFVHLNPCPRPGPPRSAPATGFSWSPGIRDRLTALRSANHLTGEDYGFLMPVLSAGSQACVATRRRRRRASKAPGIKIDVKLPGPAKAKSGGPPPLAASRATAAPPPVPAPEPVAHESQPPTDEPATEPVSADTPPEAEPESPDLDLDLGPDLDLELGEDVPDVDAAYDEVPDDLGCLDAEYDAGLDARASGRRNSG